MALPVTVDLGAYHGDTWSQTFRLIRQGEPLDLTNVTAACWAIPTGLQTATAHVELQVAIDAAAGEVTISYPAGHLDVGRWEYDLELTMPDGEVKTWVRGTLRVTQDVTNYVAPVPVAVA